MEDTKRTHLWRNRTVLAFLPPPMTILSLTPQPLSVASLVVCSDKYRTRVSRVIIAGRNSPRIPWLLRLTNARCTKCGSKCTDHWWGCYMWPQDPPCVLMHRFEMFEDYKHAIFGPRHKDCRCVWDHVESLQATLPPLSSDFLLVRNTVWIPRNALPPNYYWKHKGLTKNQKWNIYYRILWLNTFF